MSKFTHVCVELFHTSTITRSPIENRSPRFVITVRCFDCLFQTLIVSYFLETSTTGYGQFLTVTLNPLSFRFHTYYSNTYISKCISKFTVLSLSKWFIILPFRVAYLLLRIPTATDHTAPIVLLSKSGFKRQVLPPYSNTYVKKCSEIK